MNWKILFQLSLFGLVMAFGTISLIPENNEPYFWLVIFIVCAYFIAKACPGEYFLYGYLLSLFNGVWLTIIHLLFYTAYIERHTDLITMFQNNSLLTQPRLIILFMGPVWNYMWVAPGLFAFIASKIVKKNAVA